MTVTSYPIGVPPAAAQRGGDCRARDLSLGRNVLGPHRFAAVTDCRVSNGLLRATLTAGSTPTLLIEAYRPAVSISDTYGDTYADTYNGSISTPEWISLGTIQVNSTTVTAVLGGVRLVRAGRESVVIRLIVPAIGDALVTLRRGETMLRIAHGDPQEAVSVVRRVRTGANLNALFGPSRVEEMSPATDGLQLVIASHDQVTRGTFNLTTTASVRSALFAFGVGIDFPGQRSADIHRQLADASRRVVA